MFSWVAKVFGRQDSRMPWAKESRPDAHEMQRAASDLGISVTDLERLAKKPLGSAKEMYRRLQMRGVDVAKLAAEHPRLVKDMERVCSLCEEKRRCRNDAENPDGGLWRTYCCNADSIDESHASQS